MPDPEECKKRHRLALAPDSQKLRWKVFTLHHRARGPDLSSFALDPLLLCLLITPPFSNLILLTVLLHRYLRDAWLCAHDVLGCQHAPCSPPEVLTPPSIFHLPVSALGGLFPRSLWACKLAFPPSPLRPVRCSLSFRSDFSPPSSLELSLISILLKSYTQFYCVINFTLNTYWPIFSLNHPPLRPGVNYPS